MTCADLHRRFHAAAAAIMSLAVCGNKQEAHNALDDNHEFGKISREQMRALLAWKDA